MPGHETDASATGTPAGPAPVPGDALVVVDVQHDFVSGALAVPHGDDVIAPLNRAVEAFRQRGLPVIATRDWHPPDHCSFAAQRGPWPAHCVAGSPGAEFAGGLRLPQGTVVVSKATHPGEEAYSAFAGTSLDEVLRARGISRLFVGGLATDYCVISTVRDALARGFAVTVLSDAVRPVDVHPGDGARAEDEMRRAGARFTTTASVVGTPPDPQH